MQNIYLTTSNTQELEGVMAQVKNNELVFIILMYDNQIRQKTYVHVERVRNNENCFVTKSNWSENVVPYYNYFFHDFFCGFWVNKVEALIRPAHKL